MVDDTQENGWDDEVDVLIFGIGLAGACAAIEAITVDPDARVLICEKMPEDRAGGNSRASGQSLWIGSDVEAMKDYQRRLSESNPLPEEYLDEWARRMSVLEPWIKERAEQAEAEYIYGTGFTDRVAVREFPELGAEAAVDHTATILPFPGGVWKAFKKNVDIRPVEVRYNARALELIQVPETGEVVGAVVEEAGQRRRIRARGGVVMASGGYEADQQMQRDYCGYEEVYPLGTPANTGDGIRMLQKAGARLWHMRNRGQSGGIWPGILPPGRTTAFLRNLYWNDYSWIEVASDGRRFYNETAEHQLTHFKQLQHGRWVDTPHVTVGPVHMIFDEKTRRGTPLALRHWTWNIAAEGLTWSDDNVAEIENGTILRAETIEELASLIGQSPEVLAQTVAEYNAACREGRDDQFEREGGTLEPIEVGPFYAVRIVPALVCTSGGAKRTIDAEVLDHDDRPIPGLYEAGELGSMVSDLYQNGAYLTDAMISGRAAGKEAALRARS